MDSPTTQFAEAQLVGYLERIGLVEDAKDPHSFLPPTLKTLEKLQMNHSFHIPFDNLDMSLKLGVLRLDPDSVYKKLVCGKRGGVCFEMNHCIMYALRALGFNPVMHPALLWTNNEWRQVATHVLNIVEVDGRKWLVDVGFGNNFVELLPLVADVESTQLGISFKLTESCDDSEVTWFTLHRKNNAYNNTDYCEWVQLLKFRMIPMTLMELDGAMDLIQNRLDFAKDHFVSKPTPEGGRISLLSGVHIGNPVGSAGCCLCIRSTSSAAREQISVSEEDKAHVLKKHFGIVLATDGSPE